MECYPILPLEEEFLKLEVDMVRVYLIILIFQLGVIFQGCAALEFFDGSLKEEVEALKMSKEQVSNEAERLKAENSDLQKQIDALQEENQRIKDEHGNKIAKLRDENQLLNGQISTLRDEKKSIGDENKILKEKLTTLSLQNELKRERGKLRIKVLSGDGNLYSAKEMREKLKSRGYQIEFIDYASSPNFPQNTIYFKPNFQNEAKQIVSHLGGNTISKPLSWSSIFDLIVVTGRSH